MKKIAILFFLLSLIHQKEINFEVKFTPNSEYDMTQKLNSIVNTRYIVKDNVIPKPKEKEPTKIENSVFYRMKLKTGTLTGSSLPVEAELLESPLPNAPEGLTLYGKIVRDTLRVDSIYPKYIYESQFVQYVSSITNLLS